MNRCMTCVEYTRCLSVIPHKFNVGCIKRLIEFSYEGEYKYLEQFNDLDIGVISRLTLERIQARKEDVT